MTRPTSTSTEQTADGAEDFTTGEGLRALLNRLAEGGEDAWVHDPVARDLMEFAADKYRALARKHRLDTWEAVTAGQPVKALCAYRMEVRVHADSWRRRVAAP